METNVTDFNSLEQGLAGKVSELEAQRLVRETLLVDITLEAIANGVVSKEQDIIQLMSGKQWQAALREIVIREVKRAADERLWCREYDEKAKSNQRMLVRQGRLPKDAQFQSKCLFGEHLLARYPESIVVLVESPKNALFGALAFPLWTWVATGNKGMLRREVLQPLQGRDVIVIPDRDAIAEWSAAITKMADLANFTVFDICRQKAPEGNLKFDIADYIQQQHPVPF